VKDMASRERAFHVGDHALYRFGPQDAEVEVIEERVRSASAARASCASASRSPTPKRSS